LAGLLLTGACGGSKTPGGKPESSLAGSRKAQQSFRSLRDRFFSATGTLRQALVPELRRFLEQFPDDARAREVRAYLALLLVENNELDAAERTLGGALRGPAGSAGDLTRIADSAIMRARGRPQRALEQLKPLRGKIVDADERLLFAEQLVQTALAAGSRQKAIEFMRDWVAQAPPDAQKSVRDQVQQAVAGLPTDALESGLLALQGDTPGAAGVDGNEQARAFIRKTIRGELTRRAIQGKDAKLAQRLLDTAPAATRAGEVGAELGRVAASGLVQARVVGRSIGLVLSLGPETRRRSAAVSAGMTRALELFAPRVAEQTLRLIVRDDGGNADALPRAMQELAGDGASILVAGVDAESATRAARQAESASIAVILLHPPATMPEKVKYSFVLGVDSEQAAQALQTELERRTTVPSARVGFGGVPCDAQAQSAGMSRFPVADWKRDRVRALMLLGDAACSRAVIREAERIGFSPVLAFGLESAELFPSARFDTLSAAVGRFPVETGKVEGSGAPASWYELLGRDAAVLAAAALADLPLDRVEQARAVAERHEQARRRLATAKAQLLTADAGGFNKANVMERLISSVFAAKPRRVR
jgi:hypothetical protein